MNRKYCCNALFLFFLSGLIFMGCTENGNEQLVGEYNCPQVSQAPVAGQLDSLNIFIETSGSMGGFMPTREGEQTDFQMVVDGLLANAESLEGNQVETLRYYSAREKMYKEVYSRFSQTLRRGLRNVGSSSPIPQMLNNISEDHVGEEQVSIFISDFIYSPPNLRDRDFIANDIRRALGKIRQENMVVSVFAAQSDFSGTYYPADSKNSPVRKCCKTKVPYYIWVMGPEEKVRLVNQAIIQDNFLEQVHFGFDVQAPAYMVIPGSGRAGAWYPGDAEGALIKLDDSREIKQGEFSYTIGLQLNDLPGHVSSAEYLRNNLRLNVINGEATIQDVYSRDQFLNNEDINNKDRGLIDCFSHFVKVSVTEVYDRNAGIKINLLLGNNLPAWINAYTTDNDSQIEEEGPRTFAFSEIMKGAREVTGRQDGEFFDLTTTIDLSR